MVPVRFKSGLVPYQGGFRSKNVKLPTAGHFCTVTKQLPEHPVLFYLFVEREFVSLKASVFAILSDRDFSSQDFARNPRNSPLQRYLQVISRSASANSSYLSIGFVRFVELCFEISIFYWKNRLWFAGFSDFEMMCRSRVCTERVYIEMFLWTSGFGIWIDHCRVWFPAFF